MSKTLFFAPSFLDGDDLLNSPRYDRVVRWIEFYTDIKSLKFDQIFMVDDASEPKKLNQLITTYPNIVVHKCKKHFGRRTHLAYSAWYRSFKIACDYAIKNDFDKVIHIDTDFFLLNNNICDYFNNLDSGWTTFWCDMFKFPETGMQVICKDQLKNAYQFYDEDFLEYYPYDAAEKRAPVTHIEKKFNGDRFGEAKTKVEQNDTMDYYGQTPISTKIKFNY